jgi:hypothetical protein
VLGAQRGSAVAQTQRDLTERKQFVLEYIAAVDARYGVESEGGRATIINTLLRVAQEQEQQTENSQEGAGNTKLKTLAAETFAMQMASMADIDSEVARELAVLADMGDPREWPGFTEPAVMALGKYFSGHNEGSSVFDYGDWVLSILFSNRYDAARYQRLLPICEGVGFFVKTQSGIPSGIPGTTICDKAAMIMKDAPPEALETALASWVDAFTERLSKKVASAVERGAMEKMLVDQVTAVGAPVRCFRNAARLLGYSEEKK